MSGEEDPLVRQCQGRIGRMISGKWRLDALIGVGGMAAVYMATHRNGSVAAVKILHDEVATNEEVRERFLREAYIANKVGHEGTVKVLDDDQDETGTPYLVMELLQGKSIEALAEQSGGRLSIKETLDIIDQTLAVLEAAHAQKIIHRDLKPENLFMTKGGTVKVLDFGIARLREDNARKTQTGMVMGTPSFMAPEQAMGRWSDVDHRTDLYAVGATAFTLLSGLPVHEAETAGEMLVAAATRPARSLARVLNTAPFNLVALIDRSLAYERDNRIPNATTFRAELAKLRDNLGEEEISKTMVSPEAVVMPATVHGEAAEREYERLERDARLDTFDPSMNSPQEIDAMVEVFAQLERALVALKQYGTDHPEPRRRMEETFKYLASALMTCDVCLAWNLTPYAFVAGDRVVWEPEAPWNRIPYQLFADGVRTMGLVPGLTEEEFERWIEILMVDPTEDFSPEDDIVTLMWEADLENAFHQAIDTFADGNQDERARFEARRNHVIKGAQLEQPREIAEAFQQGKGQQRAAQSAQQIVGYLARSEPLDVETAARVANLNLQEVTPEEAQAGAAVRIDASTKALLGARLDLDVANTSDRFVVAAAQAFIASAKMGRSASVTAPLKRAVDGLGQSAPGKAMEMVLELREAVEVEDELETENFRASLTSEVLSPETLRAILAGSVGLEEQEAKEYLRGLTEILECILGQHIESALDFLPEAPKGEVRALLLEFVEREGRGHEKRIGELFKTADLELGLDLVRLLVAIDSPESKEAVAMASQSPHPLVRIEALGHLEGVSSTRLRTELKKLLEDDRDDVRLAALKAMEDHNIAVAGPFLVITIQDKKFLKAPFAERRQSLQTLVKLRPKRAEELCVELLQQAKLFKGDALESTRAMAAEFLGQVASSAASLALLEATASGSRWMHSEQVRNAAAAAAQIVTKRAEEAAARRAEAEAKRPKKRRRTRPGGEKTRGATHAEGDGPPRKRRRRRTRPADDAGEPPREPQAAGGKP